MLDLSSEQRSTLLATRDSASRNRDDTGSDAWYAAHREGKKLDRAAAETQQAVFDAGLEYQPHWWVKPGSYEDKKV